MKFENEWTRTDTVQKIAIEDLEQKNKELIIQLHDSEVAVASLNVEVTRLENGMLELTVKLNDAADEIGRLTMVVKHKVVPPAKKP